MKLALCASAILSLFAAAAVGQTDAELSAPTNSAELTPAITKTVEIIKSQGWSKTLLYIEIDDQQPGDAVVRMEIVGRVTGVDALLTYSAPERTELMDALRPDLPAPGAPGWRRLAIIVEGQSVTVAPGPRAGSMESFSGRMRALVDRVLSKIPTPEEAAE